MAKTFLVELAEYFQGLPKEERKNIAHTQNYIRFNEKKLYEKFKRYYINQKKGSYTQKDLPDPIPSQKDLDTHLFSLSREVVEWEDMNLDFMYERTMFLSDQLFPDYVLFKEMADGEISLPDIETVFNRLRRLARKLLLKIYPDIEKLLTHDMNIEQISSSIIKGKINWNDTIINSIKQSGGIPIKFTCMVPRRKFDTPENILLLISINWLLNDAKLLLSFGNVQKYSTEQNQFLVNIQEIARRILDTTSLKEIREQAERISKERRHSKTVNELIYKSNLRISRNISKPHYRNLITWIRQYIDFNVNLYKSLLNFGYERLEHVDTMFELWILFEIGFHFRTRNWKVNPIMRTEMEEMFPEFKIKRWDKLDKKKRGLYGFRIKNSEGISFDLIYDLPDYYKQQSSPGQYYQPDFLFRFGNNLVPLIMDAKNWHVGHRADAKRTMIVYLAELDYLNPSCAIILFPTYSRTGVPPTKNKPLKEYDEIVIGSKFPEEYRKHWSIIEANFVPSRKTEDKLVGKEILNKIYEILQQYIAPVPKITS